MAIRIKNLDLNTQGMKRQLSCHVGDVTADGVLVPFFAAPVACVVNHIDLYTSGRMPPAQTTASVTVAQPVVVFATASGTIVGQKSTSTSASNATNAISAMQRIRITPTANNSLSVGHPLALFISAQGSGALSSVLVVTTYTPLVHRETT